MVMTSLCICPSGCKDGRSIKVTAVTVKEAVYSGSSSMVIRMKDNATLQLTPFIMPQDATHTAVEYSNHNPELMELSQSGFITAKAIGKAVFTISATDGSGVRTSYPVEIADHMVKATGISVTAAGSNILLKTGGASFSLAACVSLTPEDTWNKAVTYKSSDKNIAAVTAEGIVSPVAAGKAVITVTTADGSNISRDCNVTVE